MLVTPLLGRTGNPVVNQYDVSCEYGRFFQSYRTRVAKYVDGQLYINEDHPYSRTTTKYLNQWLCKHGLDIDTAERINM